MYEANFEGRVIAGRYRILRHLARGGMANVYLAEDERLERQVALKIISPHLAADQRFRSKFVREARVAAKLNHPNLVNVFDQGEDTNALFLVMEYVPGMTLRDALQRFDKLAPLRTLEIFTKVVEGLAAAHRAGILHRDVKPENVFLADDGRIKLGDFGLARSADAATATDSLLGTIAYVAPELITRGQVDARADVYASGIMLYEMLTGHQPFKGDQAAHVAHQHTNTPMPAPSVIAPEVPALLDELVLWTTAKDPADRPANAAELGLVLVKAEAEIRAGRGGTTKLDLPEFADRQATRVIDVNTVRIAVDDLVGGAAYPTTANLDGANPTAVVPAVEPEPPVSPLERLAKRRKRNAKWVAFTIFLTTLLATAAGWFVSVGPGGFTTVPDLTSRTEAQARTALEPFDFKIVVKREPSNTVSQDLVTRTDPSSGALVLRGSQVVIYTSSGPKQVVLPNLNGSTLDSAKTVIVREGLNIGEISNWFSPTAKGLVFDYTGADGSELPQGATIDIRVSLGDIPVVEQLDQATAIRRLQDAGIIIGAIDSTQFSSKVPKGLVIGVSPETSPLAKGGKVTLLVSRGPNQVKMPNVIGETISAAKLELTGLGLNVVVNTDQLEKNWGIVKVKTQTVPAGTLVPVTSSVTISNK